MGWMKKETSGLQHLQIPQQVPIYSHSCRNSMETSSNCANWLQSVFLESVTQYFFFLDIKYSLHPQTALASSQCDKQLVWLRLLFLGAKVVGVAGLGGDVKSALSPSRPFVRNSSTSPPGHGDPRQLLGMKSLWNLPCLRSLFCFE